MALDLNQVQQAFLRANSNIDEMMSKFYDTFYNPTPLDITLEWTKADGTVQNVTVPNRAKIKAQMWDDVGGAVGQWRRSIYVDNEVGDDTNPGTADAPIKTIRQALSLIPVGGIGYIYLKEGQTHLVDDKLFVENKFLYFRTWNYSTDKTANAYISNTAYTMVASDGTVQACTNGFICRNSVLAFYFVNIRTPNYPTDATALGIWEGLVRRWDLSGGGVWIFSALVELGDTDLIRIPNGAHGLIDLYVYNSTVQRVGPNRDSYLLVNEVGSMVVNQNNSGFILSDGSAGGLADFITGVVTDANGVPRNLLSNVVF